jgi:AcrR family transcriptional regulator
MPCENSLGILHGLLKKRQWFHQARGYPQLVERSLTQLSQVKPGGHPLRREVVVHHQRQRILTAVVEIVAEHGYRATSVAAIIKRAGVSKLKFYENFSSKPDAFLAAFDEALAEAAQRLGAAAEAAGVDPAARVDAGIGALLDFLAERPALARACILEAPSLGGQMGERRASALAAFAPLLAGNLEETVLDGLYSLLYEALAAGKPKQLRRLRPALVEFALLPFLGPVGARAAASA